MKRRWFLFVFLLLMMPSTCFAVENRGYIRLSMTYDGESVIGGTVTIYDVTGIADELSPEELADYAKRNSLPEQTKTVNSGGLVKFENLVPGQYLLTQDKAAEGFFKMKPFCVSLPMMVDGDLCYEIDASPKLEPEHKLPQTGQLIWPAWAFIGLGLVFIGIGLSNQKRE